MPAVDDKEILLTQTLLLGDGQVGTLDVVVERDTTFHVSIRCVESEREEPVIEWQFKEGVLNITLAGWNSPFGAGFVKPHRVGDLRGTPIGFNVAHQRLGHLNCLTIQFYLGGQYE